MNNTGHRRSSRSYTREETGKFIQGLPHNVSIKYSPEVELATCLIDVFDMAQVLCWQSEKLICLLPCLTNECIVKQALNVLFYVIRIVICKSCYVNIKLSKYYILVYDQRTASVEAIE